MTVINPAWKTDLANLNSGKNINISTAVTNLITGLLGRTPSMTEIASYINSYDSGVYATGAQVYLTQNAESIFLSKIFNSTEFQDPNISNSAYVTKLYLDIMGRAPDAMGQAYWTNKLTNGATRANIANNFLSATEFSIPTGFESSNLLTTQPVASQLWKSDLQSVVNGSSVDLTSAINHAFQALVGRAATASEFNAVNKAAQPGLSPSDSNIVTSAATANILHHILSSDSFLNNTSSNADFVNNLYTTVLGRNSDTVGAQFWTDQLLKGASRSDIATTFITSNEFSGATGFNYYSSLLSQALNVLWQNSPTSWVGNPAQAAYQLKSLMGSNTNWTLVLDFNPQYAAKGNSGGWTEQTLTAFMEALQSAGVSPSQILYHPDGEDVAGWFPGGATPSPDPTIKDSSGKVIPNPNYDPNFYQDYTTALAQWMVTLNAALQKDKTLSPNYQLSGLVGEGKYLPKNSDTYNDFVSAFNTLKVNPTPKLWFTGNWEGSNTLSPSTGKLASAGDPTTGYFVQLYDYYWTLKNNTYLADQYFIQNDGSTLGKKLPTNPGDATNAGHELLKTLGSDINPDLFNNIGRTVLTLNFTGLLHNGPVFGPYIPADTGVTAPWGLDATYALLSGLQDQAKILSGGNTSPNIAIWSIEDALNTFYPVIPINPTTFTVPSAASKYHFQGALENNPKIFTPNNGGSIALNLQLNDATMKGIGLVSVYDKLGDLLASDGHLVTPNDPGYNQLALQQATQKGLWQDVSNIANSSTTLNWSVNPATSYVLVVQDSTGQIQTSLGHNSLGNSWLANGLGADTGKLGIQLSGWNPVVGASFDNAILKINGLQGINAATSYPIVNVLWEDYASWDTITAKQLANLISYKVTNGDTVTYPNAGLEFIVSGVGPLSKSTPIAPSHFDSAGHTTATSFPNTPQGLANFISSISDQVFQLTNGAVKWATQGGTGSVSYHPDTTTYYSYKDTNGIVHSNLDYSTDWAGYNLPGTSETFSSDISLAYMAYVDYTLYLNKTLNGYQTQSGQKLNGFSQLVYETERTYPDDPNNAPKGLWEQNLFNNLKSYPGNLALLPNGQPIWYGSIKLAGTSEAVSNWQAGPTNGWGVDKYLAQIYDLAANVPSGDPNLSDYPYTGWNNAVFSTLKQSGAVTPTSVAQAFADFLANPSAGNPNTKINPTGTYNPKMAEYNVNRMISPQSDNTHPSTSYNPNAAFIFSYGPGKIDNTDHTKDNPLSNQPIFQYGMFDSQGNSPTSNAYRWNSTDFSNFLAAFKTDLTKNLQTIATDAGVQNSFSTPITSTPILGVWGGERALDAWIGF